MTPIQQMLLGVGAGAKKTYVDDVFSTYLFKANGSTGQTINNGINLSGEGGLVWNKDRITTYNHVLWDTVRGDDVVLRSDTNAANSTVTNGITFNSNGYSVNTAQGNESTNDTSSWTFRKAPGFFDIVTWTGNGSVRTIAHSLGTLPGCIMIKRTDSAGGWINYHRSLGPEKVLQLHTNDTPVDYDGYFNDTEPTSSVFTLGTATSVNASGGTYVAYLFAGGESTASTAVSIDFDGSNDYLSIPTSTDFDFGSGNFTVECWVKGTTNSDAGLVNLSNASAGSNSAWILYQYSGKIWFGITEDTGWDHYQGGTISLIDDQWHHVAATREGNTFKLWVDGQFDGSFDYSGALPVSTRPLEIATQNGSFLYNGQISNVRIIKGTALYTSAFRPSTAPLTNITNTKLLCCQSSTVTTATVIPSGSITANDSPTASTDSPFDDPAGFVFGENEDQNVVKCGSYAGLGNNKINVNLGWEPQFVLIKNTSESSSWLMLDSMRSIVTNGNDSRIYADKEDEEVTNGNHIDLTPTGFTVPSGATDSGHVVTYIAIRRPDGYVGKPASAGTDVFTTVVGTSATVLPPGFISGFPVDYAIVKKPDTSGHDWFTASRLTGSKYLVTNSSNDGTSTAGDFVFDSNTGWSDFGYSNIFQSWMWKRHAGFDVVTWDGTGANNTLNHSLGKTPEMIWAKARSESQSWLVYHKGLNGGTNPWSYYLTLEGTAAEANWAAWVQAPTSTQFSIISNWSANSQNYLAMLFASVDGISKCGSYTGVGGTGLTVTLGFQPRFILIKSATQSGKSWALFDTVRGLGGAGTNDARIYLNDDGAQTTGNDYFNVTSTGWTSTTDVSSHLNTNGETYIYYAHA